jgi:hypothetical protein
MISLRLIFHIAHYPLFLTLANDWRRPAIYLETCRGDFNADALLDAGAFGIQHRPAHDLEQILDALGFQAFRQDFVACEFRHLRTPL